MQLKKIEILINDNLRLLYGRFPPSPVDQAHNQSDYETNEKDPEQNREYPGETDKKPSEAKNSGCHHHQEKENR